MGIRFTGSGCGVEFATAAAAAAAAGTGEAGDEGAGAGVGGAPKIFANLASLYTQMDMLTVVVARNLPSPGVTVEKG